MKNNIASYKRKFMFLKITALMMLSMSLTLSASPLNSNSIATNTNLSTEDSAEKISQFEIQHSILKSALLIYMANNNGNTPKDFSEIEPYFSNDINYIFINKAGDVTFLNSLGAESSFINESDGSVSIVSKFTLAATKYEDGVMIYNTFQGNLSKPSAQHEFNKLENVEEEIAILENNFRMFVSGLHMYMANNNGLVPTDFSELNIYLPNNLEISSSGSVTFNFKIYSNYFFVREDDGTVTLVASYDKASSKYLNGVLKFNTEKGNLTETPQKADILEEDIEKEIVSFENDFRILVSSLNMYMANNNGNTPKNFLELKDYITSTMAINSDGTINFSVPKYYKCYFVNENDGSLTLIASYDKASSKYPDGTLKYNSSSEAISKPNEENKVIEASNSKDAMVAAFESNHRLLVSSIQMYMANNNGVAPKNLTSLNEYLPAEIKVKSNGIINIKTPATSTYRLAKDRDGSLSITSTFKKANEKYTNGVLKFNTNKGDLTNYK